MYQFYVFLQNFMERMGYNMLLSTEDMDKYWDLLFDGKKVEAIKLMRTWTSPLTVRTTCFTDYTRAASDVPRIVLDMTKDFVAPAHLRKECMLLLDAKLFADFIQDNPRIFE